MELLQLDDGLGVSSGTTVGSPCDCVLGVSGGVGVVAVIIGEAGVVAVGAGGVGVVSDEGS